MCNKFEDVYFYQSKITRNFHMIAIFVILEKLELRIASFGIE